MLRFIIGFILVFFVFSLFSQNEKGFKSNDSLYNANIKKSILYGVYIPRDIDDAMDKLVEATSPDARLSLKKIDEVTMSQKLYFGLGRWMEYNWNFEEGSRLTHYLRNKGLFYTEDMTRTMLILFHRFVCGKPLSEDELIKNIIEARKKKMGEEKLKNLKTGEIIEVKAKKP